MLIGLENIHKKYGSSHILKNINLKVDSGQHMAIQGSSGSGKSTLLYILGSLEQPDEGKVVFEGKDLAAMSDNQLAEIRNTQIGFVFQFHFLLPSMTCLDNIYLPAKIAGRLNSALKKKVADYAFALNVTECLSKYPYQISGGEQQRINLIRAISMDPKLLLCDEPTGNLDSKNTSLVINMLKELAAKIDSTLIVVTHDNEVAAAFPRKITIEDGQIIG